MPWSFATQGSSDDERYDDIRFIPHPGLISDVHEDSDSAETVDVKMDTISSEAGIIDVTGSGLGGISCLEEAIHQVWAGSHSGFGRLRQRRPDQFLRYCLDRDHTQAAIVKSFIRVGTLLIQSSCSSVGEMICGGSGGCTSAALFNDTGLKLDETVSLKLNGSASVVCSSVIRVCAGLSEPHPRRTDGFEGECQHMAHNPP